MADAGESWRSEGEGAAKLRPPEIPLDPMEFLSRSWSVPALHVSRAIEPPAPPAATAATGSIAEDDIIGEHEEEIAPTPASVAGNSFSFASAATSQLVLERIMSQSQEVSPLTSGRLSHSSGPLNGGDYLTDSPPVSPSDLDDVKYVRAISGAAKPPQLRQAGGGSGRTVGRWLKDRRERKKEEARAHNAQVHAAVSVAGVAAAVAAVAAATAAASGSTGRDERAARTDMAVASAATLVAAQCVEAAEAMGAEREHLAAVVGSAVSVRTPGDIVTLTAAAATALRGAATLRARALREVWNIAAVIPVEKGSLGAQFENRCRNPQLQKSPGAAAAGNDGSGARLSDEFMQQENFLGICSQELLARGAELLKRTRAGALHWKMVSVYINKMGQVMLKMKSRHIAGTITKKKKSVVVEVCREVAAWPGRYLLEGGERRHYFGLKTAEGRVIEFECRTQREHDLWTQGVAGLLDISGKGTHRNSLNI